MRVSRPDITIRRALASDYEDILAISHGLYNGRDILPAVYHEYLADPNRVFYVAIIKGKVASIAGGRIIDNGETYEGEGARTDPALRGTGLNLHLLVRSAILSEGVLPRWPKLKRIRIVTVGVKEVRKRPEEMQILPYGIRTVIDLIWMKPVMEYMNTIQAIERSKHTFRLPLDSVTSAGKQLLEVLFHHPTAIQHLFPNGVLIRDSQSFTVDPVYKSNIPLILGDRLHAIFVSSFKEYPEAAFHALSFGTGIESDVPKDRMRYCIDYYGAADITLIKSHILKHLLEIPKCVIKASTTVKNLICHIFMPNHVCTLVDRSEIEHFIESELGFGVIGSEDGAVEQCVADVLQSPQTVATTSSRL